jgi:subfamily B ATP-binding cassette protein MsbA
LLDAPAEADHGTTPMARAQGHLQFIQVSHRYETGQDWVLRDIDLTIQPGETIALVGPSGSGKTSLVSLLPRFYDTGSGEILLDGITIRDMPLVSLRAQFSWVGQQVILFNDTLAANIRYGTGRDVSLEELEAVAEQANALEFIRRLPAGFDTRVGENGVKLSGGQRQRIAIARALIKDAPLLILDEATSALDTQSERLVQAALEHLRQGRTTLIIAHRLSTVENADRIVVLNHGQIVEVGSHSQLLERHGMYANLYQVQLSGA